MKNSEFLENLKSFQKELRELEGSFFRGIITGSGENFAIEKSEIRKSLNDIHYWLKQIEEIVR